MCNRNFEAINQVLNKILKKIRNGIWIIHLHIFYLILCKRLRKELLIKVYITSFLHLLVTFLVIEVWRYNYDLNYKHGNFFQLLMVVFDILYTKFCLNHLLRNINLCLFFCNLKQVQIISETKLNRLNMKATRGYNCQ